jgi:pantetheine-phosphate adenylyltransferase
MKKIAVYPGTFDPVTYGHIDVIRRAAALFDTVIVAVVKNSGKQPLFTENERVEMLRSVTKKFGNVKVDRFNGLLVDYAKRKNATVLVRGLRAVSDFEYEFQMALTNRKLAPNIATVFLMPHEKYTYLNSSIVREIARLGGDTTEFVPPLVRKWLRMKLEKTPPKGS